jgi:hypothetical protein
VKGTREGLEGRGGFIERRYLGGMERESPLGDEAWGVRMGILWLARDLIRPVDPRVKVKLFRTVSWGLLYLLARDVVGAEAAVIRRGPEESGDLRACSDAL